MRRRPNTQSPAKRRNAAAPLLPGFDRPDDTESTRLPASSVNNSDSQEASISAGPLDLSFGKLMVRLNGAPNHALQLAAEAVSAWREEGHICLPLHKITASVAKLSEALRAAKVVGTPGEWKPLILDSAGRLYLYRYWRYERDLADAIRARAAAPSVSPRNIKDLSGKLDKYFLPEPDDQRSAAEAALQSHFCVITGGPGTGKTRTIARLLALLTDLAPGGSAPPRIALAAPTGKAASRMTESIRLALHELPASTRETELLPTEGKTLHRLLAITPESPQPRFDMRNPLPIDALILDEASMVDLPTMSKVFAATPLEARIVLLGDKDQLASVEAGSVLADICQAAERSGRSALARGIAHLRRSYRFEAGSGIQLLSAAINGGAADEAIRLLHEPPEGIEARPLPPASSFESQLAERATAHFRPVIAAADPFDALSELAKFRILCAVRRGPFGVETLNRLVEKALASLKIITPGPRHYHGRPVLVSRNDYTLRLFNGDIGLILHDSEAGGELRAFFIAQDGSLRRILPARLPEHETAWAMTVHKSQGSEFDRILFIVPDRDTPLLTRELLYTGVTRARRMAEIWSTDAAIREAVKRRTERHSGLCDALLSDTP